MALFFAKIILVEFLVFAVMVTGSFALSHLGLMLVSHIDRLLSPGISRQDVSPDKLSADGSR